MKLLFITQRINDQDDDLAFVILWIKEFIKQGAEVRVVCLELGNFSGDFPVYSLGKECGYGKVRRGWEFLKLIFGLNYDRVFVHMNPEYFTIAGWFWWAKRIPSYLWYTHYKMHFHLRLAAFFCKRMFAATKQSLPQYDHSPKKVVTGHGIDLDYWLGTSREEFSNQKNEKQLLTVHRICRSKRLEIVIKAIKILGLDYRLMVYGRDVEKDYYQEMFNLIKDQGLDNQISLAGPVEMSKLREIYPRYRLMVNMASETIDKTMLEGMIFGVYPVTTKGNSLAIGLPVFPENDCPETIASFIRNGVWRKYDQRFLRDIVEKKHSLPSLIRQMNEYIFNGN